ncbi:site-specific recombinase XerD [Streptomyces sp. Ag109_O5-1]|nr:site-specific recombinase XerD [Streptomyces sp. Ag109_O5-1]
MCLPSGARYWTVLDAELEVFPAADQWLRHVRFGQHRAELTTKSYAGAVVLYLHWCERTGRDWREAASEVGLFMVWLKYAPGDPQEPVSAGPGSAPVRGERRINGVLTGVRGLLSHAVTTGEVERWVLGQLYEVVSSRDLPTEALGEAPGMVSRLKARHRLQEPESDVDRASDEEAVALFRACHNARDRLIVLLLARVGLRPGQVAGLRRSDCHLLMDSRALGCDVEGPHLHIIRRANENGAWSKSRKKWVLPVDFLVVQAMDQYAAERHRMVGAGGSDFLLVNLFRAPLGSPVTTDAIGELIAALVRRAGLGRRVVARMLRHAFASNVADAGGVLDEVQALLGQSHPGSPRPYLHPAAGRLREAIERVPSPRMMSAEAES